MFLVGTGYYYERFRPGFFTVVVFLSLLTSGVQHIIHQYNRKRDLARIERLVRLGKAAAYGPKGIPLEGKRKVRVPLVGGDGPSDERSGRMVDLVVDGTDVYLVRHTQLALRVYQSNMTLPLALPGWTRTNHLGRIRRTSSSHHGYLGFLSRPLALRSPDRYQT